MGASNALTEALLASLVDMQDYGESTCDHSALSLIHSSSSMHHAP